MSPIQTRISRRNFLRQSFAFSAIASGILPAEAFAFPASSNAKHILMVGDWGKDGDHSAQSSVAHSMASYAKKRKLETDALFFLGDNWYGNLPKGVDDSRFKVQFEDMYPSSTFDCPAYVIAGNHDYHVRMPGSKIDAELAYSRRGHTRWTQPSLWYTFDLPEKDPLFKVIALDSNTPKKPGKDATHFTLTPAQYDEQLAWFTAEIARPRTAPFLVVMAHHPVFSDGKHGDNKTLMRDWEPLLRQHGAHLYLAGHDHDLQHLEFEGHPTSFVGSGAGGANIYDLKIPEAQRGPYAQKVYGFTHIEATPDKLIVSHVDNGGHILHSFSKSQDGKVTI